ncbi:unnamed protein product [Linum trigynum]|uniref:Uncharacterized protein n=1 Tax=Linum trigynum TaxID=586398 RepID=A0AAV2E4G5_9ROSI
MATQERAEQSRGVVLELPTEVCPGNKEKKVLGGSKGDAGGMGSGREGKRGGAAGSKGQETKGARDKGNVDKGHVDKMMLGGSKGVSGGVASAKDGKQGAGLVAAAGMEGKREVGVKSSNQKKQGVSRGEKMIVDTNGGRKETWEARYKKNNKEGPGEAGIKIGSGGTKKSLKIKIPLRKKDVDMQGMAGDQKTGKDMGPKLGNDHLAGKDKGKKVEAGGQSAKLPGEDMNLDEKEVGKEGLEIHQRKVDAAEEMVSGSNGKQVAFQMTAPDRRKLKKRNELQQWLRTS